MINEKFFIGEPVNFKGLCWVYPCTVREYISNLELSIYRQLLTVSYEELDDKWYEDEIQSPVPTPFQYLFLVCQQRPEFEEYAKRGFEFFLHEPVSFLYDLNVICIGDLEKEIERISSIEQLRYITEENYFDLQNLIRNSLGEDSMAPPKIEKDPRIARIKRMGRKRDRIAAKKKGLNFGTYLAAICCMGLGITPLNIGEMSKCAIQSILSLYQNREKYDVDIRAALAGAKVQPEYWIKNIE